MNKIDQLIQDLKIQETGATMEIPHEFMKSRYSDIKDYSIAPGKFCGIDEISDIFKWKKGFAYLFTGSPNAGKSTMVLYLYLLMSFRYGYKWCIWSPEMEDVELNAGIIHHAKDLINTLVWTLAGKTPYENYAKSHMCEMLKESEIESLTNWIEEHFKFIHMNNRTPSAILKAFNDANEKFNIDGYLIDPWKSVKQIMTMRSDLWLEDTLMSFKEFALETDSIMTYVVHPKSLKEYKDETGNFRVITPFDLNGGAAWFNSMDVIVSLRKLDEFTEWYTWKVRKQHLAGKKGDYTQINFNMDKYRFLWNGNDPFSDKLEF